MNININYPYGFKNIAPDYLGCNFQEQDPMETPKFFSYSKYHFVV